VQQSSVTHTKGSASDLIQQFDIKTYLGIVSECSRVTPEPVRVKFGKRANAGLLLCSYSYRPSICFIFKNTFEGVCDRVL